MFSVQLAMKHLFLLAAIVILPVARGFSQPIAQPPQINVSGSAEVKVAPDEIYLSAAVETRNESLEQAKKQNDDSISKALAFLKNSGIKEKDVQTDYINVQPNYNRDYSKTRAEYFTVQKTIQIKLTQVDSFEKVLTGLLTNGVNSVDGIEFRTSQLRKYRDQARAMAIRAAKEKADAMVSELGAKCGKVYNINAYDGGGWWSPGRYWAGRGYNNAFQNAVQNVSTAPSAESSDSTLSVGQISVSASVNVAFLIE